MHYVQLANSSMNSLGPWKRAANHKKSKLHIVRHKKYSFEMAGKTLAEGCHTASNHTLLCQNEGGFFQTELHAPAVFVRRKQEGQQLTSKGEISSPK